MTHTIRALLFTLIALFVGGVATAQPPSVVSVTAEAKPDTLAPGGKGYIAVTFTIEEPWHIYAGDGSAKGEQIPSRVKPAPAAGLTLFPPVWPKPITKELGPPGHTELVSLYEGAVVVYVPFTVDQNAKGPVAVAVKYSSQACDSNTCLPEDIGDLSVTFKVDAAAAKAPEKWPEGFDPAVFDQKPKPLPDVASDSTNSAGSGKVDLLFFSVDPNGPIGFILLLLVCAFAGFILNLMPCVLPVIPIKIAGFHRAAAHQGGGHGKAVLLGLMTALGIVAFWFVIALLISVFKSISAVNELFGNPYFQLAAAIIIGLMALGMMGGFTFQLPQWAQGVSVGHDTLKGSFLFGVMTAVLGTPCFGPFIGAALAWATQQPNALIPLTAMTFVGIGMAVPYVILAAMPGLAKKLPKAGPASDLLKTVLGLLMIAVATFFLANGIIALIAEVPYLKNLLHWWAMTLLALTASALLIFRGIPLAKTPVGKLTLFVIAVIVGGGITVWTLRLQSIEKSLYQLSAKSGGSEAHGFWKPYDAAKYKEHLSQGKVIVTDFTAEWCLNCKFLEAQILSDEMVKTVLQADGVIAMQADLTSRKAPGWARMAEINEVGIPVITIEGPGVTKPLKIYFGNTVADLMAAIEQARGKK